GQFYVVRNRPPEFLEQSHARIRHPALHRTHIATKQVPDKTPPRGEGSTYFPAVNRGDIAPNILLSPFGIERMNHSFAIQMNEIGDQTRLYLPRRQLDNRDQY